MFSQITASWIGKDFDFGGSSVFLKLVTKSQEILRLLGSLFRDIVGKAFQCSKSEIVCNFLGLTDEVGRGVGCLRKITRSLERSKGSLVSDPVSIYLILSSNFTFFTGLVNQLSLDCGL